MGHFLDKSGRRSLLSVFFLMGLVLCLGLGQLDRRSLSLEPPAATPTPPASQLVQQGIDRYQAGDYQGAIAPWQAALSTYQGQRDRRNSAIVLENLARAHRHLGQLEQAIQNWQQVITLHHQLGDEQKVGQMLTEQAQTHSRQGNYRQAIALLCAPPAADTTCKPSTAVAIARHHGDRRGETAALGSLGTAYYLEGDYERAIDWLQAGLAISQQLDPPTYTAAMMNSLGNTYASLAQADYRRAVSVSQTLYDPSFTIAQAGISRSRRRSPRVRALQRKAAGNDDQALAYFEQSLAAAQVQDHPPEILRALLNMIAIYDRTQAQALDPKTQQQARDRMARTQQQALTLLEHLPENRETVFATLKLANLWQPAPNPEARRAGSQCLNVDDPSEIQTLLQRAQVLGERIGDRRAESFALGALGHFYECRQAYEQALAFTQQARWRAESLQDRDSLYRWEWQTGRILEAQGDQTAAIAFYEQAVATLEQVRSDILSAHQDLQFDFRDAVEPIYRELIALRLDRDAFLATSAPEVRQGNLTTALQTLDSLKLAELQNYFGDDCEITALPQTAVDQVSQTADTAVFNTITLPERTAVVLTLPNGHRHLSWIEVPAAELRNTVNQYRYGLEDRSRDWSTAQQLYRWLIEPFESALASHPIKTLVFVQDGIFRTVPMAALRDGQQFLIQRYAITTTPSLQLTNPQRLDRQELRAMMVGVTEAAQIGDQSFSPLPHVSQEIERINAQLPGSRKLLDQAFTSDRLQQELDARSYPIVHIATHAEFSPEPEDTFLLTGNNQKLPIRKFDQLIRSISGPKTAIDLLTLTACQTAVGDDRAALGLAGVAIQAGARSTIASLWSINDAATAEIAERFYQALRQPELNKAQALRAAQLSLLEANGTYVHPYFWAPFILIGNWL